MIPMIENCGRVEVDRISNYGNNSSNSYGYRGNAGKSMNICENVKKVGSIEVGTRKNKAPYL